MSRRASQYSGRLDRGCAVKLALILASGKTTGVAARKFRISQAQISQLRAWFKENWEQFHGKQRAGKHGRD